MHRLIITLLILLAGTPVYGHDQQQAENHIGILSCKLQPSSGLNLLIRSTRYIRCEFVPAKDYGSEYYKGETGVAFGLDIALNRRTSISYAVLASRYSPHTQQLSGTYAGAGGTATLGLSAGGTAPIEKQDGSITLQPINTDSRGAGVSVGFTYLYLEADPR